MEQINKLSRKDRKASRPGFWQNFRNSLRKVRTSLSISQVGAKKIDLTRLILPAKVALVLVLCLGLFTAGIYLGLSSAGKTTNTNEPAPNTSLETTSAETQTDGTYPKTGETPSATASVSSAQAEPEQSQPSSKETSADESALKKPPSLSNLDWPCQGQIVKTPGPYFSEELSEWKFFPGIQIQTQVNTPVKVVLDGSIKSVTDEGNGFTIVVDHGFDIQTSYGGVISDLKPGDTVTRNQVIGKTQGQTLTFTIRNKEDYLDPREVLKPAGD